MDCIFCKIIEGEIPSYTIYEDEVVKVFLDIHPSSNGHMLIVPKKHIVDVDTINMDTLMHIMDVAKRMKKLVEIKLHADGVSLIQNNGISQEVKHFHLHVRPCYKQRNDLSVEQVYQILKSL